MTGTADGGPEVPRPRPLRVPPGALAHLRRADPALARLIARAGSVRLVVGKGEGTLGALARAIVFQQLSGKAAGTIWGRFRALLDGPAFPPPGAILAVPDERLRACGLSRGKVLSIRDLCARAAAGTLRLGELERMTDDEVARELVQVRGIGRWSAEMFLIFELGRLDVWPETDLGVRKAMMRLHRMRRLPDERRMRREGEPYRPYRTIAAWYLWRLLDGDAGDW